jgi:hypothetical protein
MGGTSVIEIGEEQWLQKDLVTFEIQLLEQLGCLLIQQSLHRVGNSLYAP